MESTFFESATVPPLRITVTTAGREHVVLRALLRQAIPMLKSPEGYRTEERLQLAQTLSTALDIDMNGEDESDFDENTVFDASEFPDEEGYEPGCELEWLVE